MTTILEENTFKIRMFRFLDTTWTEILTGEMAIDSASQILKIYYEHSNNNHLIPNCTPIDLPEFERKLMQIQIKTITKMQIEESDRTILYLWIDNNPFGLSFLSERRSRQTYQILQLLQQTSQLVETQYQKQQTTPDYLKALVKSNPGMVTTLFINNNRNAIQSLLKLAGVLSEQTASEEEKQNYFNIFKSAIRVGDKQMMYKLTQKDNFQIILKVLSWNPFNKFPFNYLKEYDRLVSFNNVLDIKENTILQTYEDNARIKFLRDVASCMFTQVDNQRTFQSMININNQTILFHLGFSDKIFQDLKSKSQSDPIAFLNLMAELWETIKTTNIDYQNRDIRQRFIQKFKQNNLHGATIAAAFQILNNPQMKNQVTTRFHEKWLQSFNSFLSHNWQFSQLWILQSSSKQCLVKLLCKLFCQSNDQNLIEIILNFVKWMIEPSDNRIVMIFRYKCYIYQELILNMWPVVKKSTRLIQLFVDFLIKAYKCDCIRTRRVLIEKKILYYLNKEMKRKPMLICVIKLLTCFLENNNLDIFENLVTRMYYKNIKQEYNRYANKNNVISSSFNLLMKKIKMTENWMAKLYFKKISMREDQEV